MSKGSRYLRQKKKDKNGKKRRPAPAVEVRVESCRKVKLFSTIQT